MMRVVWWLLFIAKAQGFWVLEKFLGIIFVRVYQKSNRDFSQGLPSVILWAMGILWIICVMAIGIRTWKQVQFQNPVLIALGSITFFVITKILDNVLE